MVKDLLKNPWNVLALVLLLIAICSLPFILNQKDDSETLDPALQQCINNAEEYNNKELTITGNKVSGKVFLKANSEDCKLSVYYLFVLTAGLPENQVGNDPALYHYAGLIGKQGESRKDMFGTGAILGLERNSTNYPSSLLSREEVSDFYGSFDGPSGVTETPYFYSYFSVEKSLDLNGYKEIFDDNWFGVVDLEPYMEKTTKEEVVTYSPNFEKAEQEGRINNEFNFVISE